MVDINSTLIPLTESPVVQGLGKVFGAVSVVVGGLFGLYLILIILRWKEARDVKCLLSEIRDDLKSLSNFMKKKK